MLSVYCNSRKNYKKVGKTHSKITKINIKIKREI